MSDASERRVRKIPGYHAGGDDSPAYRVLDEDGIVADDLTLADARLLAHGRELVAACERLEEAADLYAADQSRATDPRCGLVQPITVAEAEELNEAIRQARAALARVRGEGETR